MGKTLRIVGLLVLMILGLVGIVLATEAYTSGKVPVGILRTSAVIGTSGWDEGYVFAKGTWTTDGSPSAFPLNASDISCVREENYCYEAKAAILVGSLDAVLTIYRIEKWDARSIEYVDNTPVCFSYVYVINRSTEKLAGRRIRKEPADAWCSRFEADLKLSFVSGFEVWKALQKEHLPVALPTGVAILWVLCILGWMVHVGRRREAAA